MEVAGRLRTVIRSRARALLSALRAKLPGDAAGNGAVKSQGHVEFIREARAAGMELGDYCELKWGVVGSSERAVSALCLPHIPEGGRVVEIGTGTGRYARRVLERRPGVTYFSFEPGAGWNDYLRKRFAGLDFRVMGSDGASLAGVEEASVDFVHAHGVFVYLDTTVVLGYLVHSARVLKPGGYLLFDVFDSDDRSPEFFAFLERLMREGADRLLLSAGFLQCFLRRLDFSCVHTDNRNPNHGYYSTYLLFKKHATK